MEHSPNEDIENLNEEVERFPNDPLSEQEPPKQLRGRPKKKHKKGKKVATVKTTIYNTRNRTASNTSKSEDTSVKFVLDDHNLMNSGMTTVTTWA